MKPEFFRHELLQELENQHPTNRIMLTFAGLWTLADKDGRFEWKPKIIKLDVLPFIEFDMEETLSILEKAGFLTSYTVENKKYGQIDSFHKHQRITGKEYESGSRFPAPGNTGETPGKHPESQEGKGKGKGKRKGTAGNTPPADVDIRLTQLLIDLMGKNNPESSILRKLDENGQARWINACRLLREADGRTPEQIEAIIRFSQADDFWRGNILSMPKLREKWDQLVMKAKRKGGGDRLAGIGEWLREEKAKDAAKGGPK